MPLPTSYLGISAAASRGRFLSRRLIQDNITVKAKVFLFPDEGIEADFNFIPSQKSRLVSLPNLCLGWDFIAEFGILLDDRI